MRATGRLRALLIAVLLSGSGSVFAADTLAGLLEAARQQQLAMHPYWRALLHHEPASISGEMRSTVRSPDFFASADGHQDARAELAATLAAFFSATDSEQAARCRWPARFRWLDEQLGLSAAPQADCDAYRDWRRALAVTRVTLVFPSAYLNNPASMFGHTLLRLDSDQQGGALLAHAVNFAAMTEDEQGAVYAWKGLAGGYVGRFGLFPYYDKVREYGRIDNRDIWEYPLQLDEAQIERLLAHLWELRDVDFDYYFLRQNCAWQLLALLQVADPAWQLTDGFDYWAIPADTLQAMHARTGVVEPAVYRPALASLLQAAEARLPPAQVALVEALATSGTDPSGLASLPADEQARLLTLAHDLRYYRQRSRDRDAVTDHDSRQDPVRDQLLAMRSQLAVVSPSAGGDRPVPPADPLQGHDAARVMVGVAGAAEGHALQLRLRPAYHDLLDNPAGHTAQAQIEFLDIGLRWESASGNLQLSDLTLFDLQAVTPRTQWMRPVSWQLAAGLRRRAAAGDREDAQGDLGVYLRGGPGLAWQVSEQWLGFGFVLLDADLNRGLHADHQAGAGLEIGLLGNVLPRWRLHLRLGNFDYPAGAQGHQRYGQLDQQWQLRRNLALRLGLRVEDRSEFAATTPSLSLLRYF